MIGILIGQKHTWRDWGLRMVACQIPMPEAQTMTVDVPGMDGVIDLTEALTGAVCYQNRELTFQFDHTEGNMARWHAMRGQIAAYCHGKRMKMILDNDRGYYYYGRVHVELTKGNAINSLVALTINAEPYRYEVATSSEPWLWDAFSFAAGIIRKYGKIAVLGSKSITVIGTGKVLVPVITCSAPMTVVVGGVSHALKAGENQIADIKILPGEQILTFTGNGTVSISFRGVAL